MSIIKLNVNHIQNGKNRTKNTTRQRITIMAIAIKGTENEYG